MTKNDCADEQQVCSKVSCGQITKALPNGHRFVNKLSFKLNFKDI